MGRKINIAKVRRDFRFWYRFAINLLPLAYCMQNKYVALPLLARKRYSMHTPQISIYTLHIYITEFCVL